MYKVLGIPYCNGMSGGSRSVPAVVSLSAYLNFEASRGRNAIPARREPARTHGSSFPGYILTSMLAGLATSMAAASDGVSRCGPSALLVEPDTGRLLVLCEKSDSILRFDPQTAQIEVQEKIGKKPFAACAHPDRKRLFITCRGGQEVDELDAVSLHVLRRFPLRGDPTGVEVSGDGRRLFVGVHSLDQVAVFELETGAELKRLAVGNGPEMLRRSPTDGRIYVTNLLPDAPRMDEPCLNEVTVIDESTAQVVERVILENANAARGIAFTADGRMAIAAITRPKNLVPMVQVARGWMITNGFAVLFPESDRPPLQLLIDLPNLAFADTYSVAMTPDDRKFYLTCAGADAVVAVNMEELRQVAEEVLAERIPRPADNLGLSRRYVSARIPVGTNPRALAVSSDGHWLYVANRLDDSISVIDTNADHVVRTMVIGEASPPDQLLHGERLFNSAARTFQTQFSCASCHPDEGFDALQYDMEPDGVGTAIIDNRNMRAIAGTGPFKWTGGNPDIATQCGVRTAKWIVRTGWLSSAEVVDLATYIESIEAVANPYRSPDGVLTPAQKRGRVLFERSTTNRGEPIPEKSRCNYCHRGPKFTNGESFDVGTKARHDTTSRFDTAHLTNIFESGPYLHDGRAPTLEEIWTKYNLKDEHGISNDWTKEQLNDLVEYLKSL